MYSVLIDTCSLAAAHGAHILCTTIGKGKLCGGDEGPVKVTCVTELDTLPVHYTHESRSMSVAPEEIIEMSERGLMYVRKAEIDRDTCDGKLHLGIWWYYLIKSVAA